MNTPALPLALQEIASSTPEAVALVQADRHITYAELTQSINILAEFLRKNITPGAKVAMLMDNGIDYVIAVYAVWRAGGILVALNTALQAEEHVALLQHSEASVCILEKRNTRLLELLAETESPPFLITLFEDELVHASQNWRAIIQAHGFQTHSSADSLSEKIGSGFGYFLESSFEEKQAMVIYTSGTTGAPKGVVLTHANLAANIAAIREYLALRRDDVVMCVLPFFYSFGNSVLHSHLLSGSRIVLENSLMYPHRVLERMVEHGVTVFYGVPSTYYLLLARTQLREYALGALRLCAQAGGHMNPEKIALFREQVPHCDFVVMYGQTEASARITYLPAAMQHIKAGSVGIAIPGVSIRLFNEEGAECKADEQGEVCVRGPNVMQAYLKDKEQTTKAIRNGWLHTGDLGYMDKEGYLYLVGRNSEMIKTGAHRVSPLEIEELVARVDGVAEVAVAAEEDEILGSAIACYIVKHQINEDEAVLRKRIMQNCKARLPAYKLPKAIYYLDTLPKTASGKVIKRMLTART